MKISMAKRIVPNKKTDAELERLILEKIKNTQYIITKHAKVRQSTRHILDTTIIHILKEVKNKVTKRNKSKDKYDANFEDWNYCYEGNDEDDNKIRIIISFDKENLLLIITVINLSEEGRGL